MASSNCHKHILRDFSIAEKQSNFTLGEIYLSAFMAVWHYGIIFTNSSKKSFCIKMESLFIRKLRTLRDFFAGEEKCCTKSSPMAGVKSDACFRCSCSCIVLQCFAELLPFFAVCVWQLWNHSPCNYK